MVNRHNPYYGGNTPSVYFQVKYTEEESLHHVIDYDDLPSSIIIEHALVARTFPSYQFRIYINLTFYIDDD